MSSNEKDQIGGDICKNHAIRCDKDLHRVCPSKLSKRELEDLYYSLLDNNQELKRAVNGQNEKIRLLTTKVNRMTAQSKIYVTKEPKDCCAGAKAVINDQKTSIAELKKANECMSERIKRLNMRLCSARQFLKKSPSQTVNKCYKCFSGASTTVKNQSTSALNTRSSDANLKSIALSAIDREPPITNTVETNTVEWEKLIQDLKPEKSCDASKCKLTMEELKQKIVDLQEELSKSRTDHSARMSQLEQHVARLTAAARAHGERTQRQERETRQVVTEREQLEIQLSTERMRVTELEMRLKSAEMSKEVSTTIEKHLHNVNQLEEKRSAQNGRKRCVCNVCTRRCSISKTQTELPSSSKLPGLMTFEDRQMVSDDSGYAEHDQSYEKNGSISKLNQDLVNKIAHLQEQLDYIKSTVVDPASDIPSKSTFESYEAIVNESELPVLKNVKDYSCVIIDPKSKVIVEIAHVNKDINGLDDELVDSDVEANYNEKVRTREQGSMKSENRSVNIQSKENVFHEIDKNSLEEESSSRSLNTRRRTIEENNSPPTVEHITKDTVFNSTVKPLENHDLYNQNDSSLNRKKEDEKDYYIVPTTTIENRDTNIVKCKRRIICECPRCISEPAKNSQTPGSQMESPDFFESKLLQSPSQDNIVSSNPQPDQLKNKPDTHNSLQIPGPIPTSQRDSTFSRLSKASIKVERLKEKPARNIDSAEEKKANDQADNPTKDLEISNTVKYGRSVGTISKLADFENVTVGENTIGKEKTIQNKPEINLDDKTLNDNNDIYKPSTSKDMPTNGENKVEDERTVVKQRKSIIEGQQLNDVEDIVRESRSVKEEVKRLNEGVIESSACCRHSTEDNKIEKRFEKCKTVKDKASPSNPGNTYTVSPERRSRATTPDSTECEISFMSDLPTEKEDIIPGLSTRSTLSPGEYRMTSTDRASSTPCHWSSISEGEVPNSGRKQTKKLSISVGEHPGDETTNPHFPEAAAAKMEAALQAISHELARCRVMLQSRRPREQAASKDAETVADLGREDSIQLRRSPANPSISGTVAPKCVFILHIGTIVLSDEAVMSTRSVPLMLTWKFFDQSAAMTRMRPGRVVPFHFSTEYEAKLTDEFLEYMRHVEMPIKVCEMDDKEKPFAMCWLPLREALLNANRRADLSLELLGDQRRRKAHDSVDARSEVGVLDLWCMLRTEPKYFVALQRAIGMNSGLSMPNQPLNQAQYADDGQSYDCGLSQDLELDVSSVSKQRIESNLACDAGNQSANDKLGQNTTSNDIYVPESVNVSLPPVNVHHVTARHRNLTAPSVTSNLRMAGSDANCDPPDVDVTRPGLILTEVAPKVRATGGMKNEFERQHDIVYPSYDKFHEKQDNRRLHSFMIDPNYTSRASGPSRISEHVRPSEPPPPVKELEINKELPSLESESLSRHRKFRESGEKAPVKIIIPPKELQSLESENINTHKKFSDNSTQSMEGIKKVTIAPSHSSEKSITRDPNLEPREDKIIEITVLWLALNEECEAMTDPNVRRLYVSYSFLGRDGAELETPVSLPKPKYYIDKCFFNFKKTFHLTEFDMPTIEHMVNCRSQNRKAHNSRDCIVFSVVSEPPEDPLGLENCEDIGYAHLYLGDVLAGSAGDSFAEVAPVRAARGAGVCGVLAVRLAGLSALRPLAARD